MANDTKIQFTLAAVPAFEQISNELTEAGFPVISTDAESSSITVDASTDPSEYSVLMAAIEAAEAAGIEGDEVLHTELV
jgi:hypothetical protein